LLATILTRKGYSVEKAQNGEEGIRVITEREFNAIVLDLMMPKVDGFEVIEHLDRTVPEKLRRCVIILTAAANRDLRKLDESKVFRVLRKPFDLDEMVATVAECVEEPARGKESEATTVTLQRAEGIGPILAAKGTLP
jgi:CheY-like chemotaxis protein